MAISSKLLSEDEHVVVATRTHVKALLWPAVMLILVAALAGYVYSLPPAGSAQSGLHIAIVVVAILLVCWFVLRPFLRWMTTEYTVTNRRLITRTGILSRRGHDIPLVRINDVSYEHGIIDRLLGCGTLVISDASEHGRVTLPDIPHVEQVHLKISDLLFAHLDGHTDGDPGRKARRLDDGT